MGKEEMGKAMLESERFKACWKELPLNVREEYLKRAGRVIKALEADVPTNLMGCLLGKGDIVSALEHEGYLSAKNIITAPQMKECKVIAKAQLQKVAPYIEAQKKEGYKLGVADQWECQQIDLEAVKKAEGERILHHLQEKYPKAGFYTNENKAGGG